MSNTSASTDAHSAKAGFDLTQFYQVFFEEAAENLDSMEQHLLTLDIDAPGDETLNAIFRCAHSIKGGAATFGFSELAELTHTMETLLDRLRRHEIPLTTPMVDTLLAAGDTLHAMLGHRQSGEGDAPDATDLKAAFAAFARGEAAAVPVVTASVPAPVAAPAATPAAAAAATPAAAPQAAAVPAGSRELELLAGPLASTSVADDLLELFAEVAGVGELSRAEPAAGQDENSIRFHLVTSSTDDDLLDLCGFHVPREQIRLTPWKAGAAAAKPEDDFGLFEENITIAPVAAVSPAVVVVVPPVPAAPAAAKKPAARVAGGETTIRVAVDKVDQLINLMGELVITQAMLSQRASMLDGSAHQQLVSGLADLERTTRDLQDSVMSIRMIPMADVFNRFPRMLRDLAAKLGKQVELQTVGEATELDKSLIEKITDPLTHLVRNSVDHGIELPADRIAAGKPAHGTLTLSARHAGGCILIEVRDDGRGLNRERILAKARSSGMVLPDNISDADVWQLIFAPGFSTAEVVTDVSGRGVGMDVVKRNILALGGRVDLDSAPGMGTCVSVRLPLTLAIMDGMSVSIGNELYVLPLSSVVESFQAQPSAVRTLAGGGRVVKVREDYLPVVALHDTFALQRTQQVMNDGPASLMLVIVEAEGRQVALQVDQLVGQQQVVVKNLEANFSKVPNVSGATIMGDGRVALILDVSALAGEPN